MRHNRAFEIEDAAWVRDLVDTVGWATLVTSTADGPVASHYPVMLEPPTADAAADDLVFLTHLGKPDERLLDLDRVVADGEDMLVIVQGRHGYVSPSWYPPGSSKAPTWNYSVAHCWGRPEILDAEANLDTLEALVAHFERHVDEPMWLDRTWGAPVARGTVGLRIPVTRMRAKAKLGQDKDPATVEAVISALRQDGPYANPGLADDMENACREP